ncbi:MAG: hypothetical protein J7M24_01160 [Candidatus Latescibacteria bacterium]|nr:hypothetical protein [Candidatus Latescibacterota bacterium]
MRSALRYIFVAALIAVTVSMFASGVKAQPGMANASGASILRTGKKFIPKFSSVSLLDPEHFTMKNQYIMNFSSSSGNGSLMGMFINSMEYRFNMPLIMRMKVAYQTQSGQLFGGRNGYAGQPNSGQGRVFIPSFDLIYKPFKNTTISFHYRDYSSAYNQYYGSRYMSRYSRRYNPYGMSPMWESW